MAILDALDERPYTREQLAKMPKVGEPVTLTDSIVDGKLVVVQLLDAKTHWVQYDEGNGIYRRVEKKRGQLLFFDRNWRGAPDGLSGAPR